MPKSYSIQVDVQADGYAVYSDGECWLFSDAADMEVHVGKWSRYLQGELRAARRPLSDLTSRWPSIAMMAREAGIEPSHLHTMIVRGSIPVEYWPGVIRAALVRGWLEINAEYMLALHTAGAQR